MTLDQLIERCLSTDPAIVPGDYTVMFSGSKSGALNAGILLFTSSPLPKKTVDTIEYRLVSILMMLSDIDSQTSGNGTASDFLISLKPDFRDMPQSNPSSLVDALEQRGIRSELARELVIGRNNIV